MRKVSVNTLLFDCERVLTEYFFEKGGIKLIIFDIFWMILGVGIALPTTLILIHNVWLKAKEGDNYELNLSQLGKVYFIALLGWAIALGVK